MRKLLIIFASAIMLLALTGCKDEFDVEQQPYEHAHLFNRPVENALKVYCVYCDEFIPWDCSVYGHIDLTNDDTCNVCSSKLYDCNNGIHIPNRMEECKYCREFTITNEMWNCETNGHLSHWTENGYICRFCGKTITQNDEGGRGFVGGDPNCSHTDRNRDHRCDNCGVPICFGNTNSSAHSFGSNGKCRYCWTSICNSELSNPLSDHIDANYDYTCDRCSEVFCQSGIKQHFDVNHNGYCDRCHMQVNVDLNSTLPACTNLQGHNFTNNTVISEPTCTSTGISKHVCATCGVEELFVTPMAKHQFSEQWTIDELPTYKVTGKKHKTCLTCDMTIDATIEKRTGISASAKTIIVVGTSSAAIVGVVYAICKRKAVDSIASGSIKSDNNENGVAKGIAKKITRETNDTLHSPVTKKVKLPFKNVVTDINQSSKLYEILAIISSLKYVDFISSESLIKQKDNLYLMYIYDEHTYENARDIINHDIQEEEENKKEDIIKGIQSNKFAFIVTKEVDEMHHESIELLTGNENVTGYAIDDDKEPAKTAMALLIPTYYKIPSKENYLNYIDELAKALNLTSISNIIKIIKNGEKLANALNEKKMKFSDFVVIGDVFASLTDCKEIKDFIEPFKFVLKAYKAIQKPEDKVAFIEAIDSSVNVEETIEKLLKDTKL